MEQVKCTQCNGYYKIREGKYGFFGGCSNFPRCKSTLKMPDMLAQFFNINGVNIYGWDRVCRNCKKTSKVYTYYLDYEIAKFFKKKFYSTIFKDFVGIGDMSCIDNILLEKYPTIQSRYSSTTKRRQVVNTCKYCGELQKRNDAQEGQIGFIGAHYNCSDEYLIESLKFELKDEFKKDISPFLLSRSYSSTVRIKCLYCDGYYKFNNKDYTNTFDEAGYFAQCSNNQICQSKLNLCDLAIRFFQSNGVNIYGWNKICWNCKNTTMVYSYYLSYQLYNGFCDDFAPDLLDLGTIPCIDAILAERYATICINPLYLEIDTKSYFWEKYGAFHDYADNVCEHCGALQDIKYADEEPHEILPNIYYNYMEKYLVETLMVEPMAKFIRDIRFWFGEEGILTEQEILMKQENIIKRVKCTQCCGFYEVGERNKGLYVSCSNYPRCESTLEKLDLLVRFFVMNGINIYAWDKICWKCKKTTKVYSYYLTYEIAEIYAAICDACKKEIGLGDISYIDNILIKRYPNIQPRYSKTEKKNRIVNICEHCDAFQERSYVVDEPNEIMWEITSRDNSMRKYLVETMSIESIDEFKKDLKWILKCICKYF